MKPEEAKWDGRREKVKNEKHKESLKKKREQGRRRGIKFEGDETEWLESGESEVSKAREKERKQQRTSESSSGRLGYVTLSSQISRTVQAAAAVLVHKRSRYLFRLSRRNSCR
jgi:hypothetical protein